MSQRRSPADAQTLSRRPVHGADHDADEAAAPRRASSLDQLREQARAAVELGSLRAVAREVGMSPAGLQHFLDGGTPFAKTRKKLVRWHGQITPETAEEALDLLLHPLPAEERRAELPRVAEFIAPVFDTRNTSRPAWLTALLPRNDEKPGQ